MGLKDYFQTSTKAAAKARPNNLAIEKAPAPDLTDVRQSVFLTGSTAASDNTLERSLARSHMSVDNIKHQVILNYLWQKQRGLMWISDTTGQNEGVMVRKNRTEYLTRPTNLALSPFAAAMALLNVQAAMTVNSSVIEPFLNWSPGAVDVPLMNGLRIQILPSLGDLPRARRHQYAAFIKREAILVVWEDDPTLLYNRAKTIEDGLLQTVWQTGANEKLAAQPQVSEVDSESGRGVSVAEDRPVMYFNTVMVSVSICLLTALIGLGYSQLALEVIVLKHWISLAYLIMTPVTAFLALFFCNVIIGFFAQLFGPIQQMSKNTRFFSAKPPPRLFDAVLPHVTFQCPVYKEGLSAVIEPTIRSIKKAISTYELQGGSANIFINDDGLQVISEEDRQARIDFYADNGIGWTARPPHGVDGYVRKGKFKKASNMNFGLALSNSVEQKLQAMNRPDTWTQVDEVEAFDRCLEEVLSENPQAWADGNIRIGDYILLVDSDTEVPEDCLLDAAGEMDQSPEVGIIQFSSAVMQVSHNFFENGITFFTNLIYTSIRFAVSNGTVAAFVGHNAILRWSAVQATSFEDEDGIERFWSESCVSEDFDMALRLQMNGYIIRMAAWAGDGFKEGVSLTVYDELTRWQKYAYGCNELLFNPIRTWLWKSPFTPLFRRFLMSNIDVASKLGIISYIGTYYAIGAAWIFTVVNYVFVGLYNGYLDRVYLGSWQIWAAITVVFSLAGNVGLAVQRHRAGEKAIVPALLENFKWCIMFSIFFGGLSLHMSQALLCHMFEIPMSWGATSKEVEFSNFFLEVPKVLKSFKYTFAMCLVAIVAMVVMAVAPFVPWSYNITDLIAIFPLALMCASHLLLPIALNPEMMTFSW